MFSTHNNPIPTPLLPPPPPPPSPQKKILWEVEVPFGPKLNSRTDMYTHWHFGIKRLSIVGYLFLSSYYYLFILNQKLQQVQAFAVIPDYRSLEMLKSNEFTRHNLFTPNLLLTLQWQICLFLGFISFSLFLLSFLLFWLGDRGRGSTIV